MKTDFLNFQSASNSETSENHDPSAAWTFFDPASPRYALPESDFQGAQRFRPVHSTGRRVGLLSLLFLAAALLLIGCGEKPAPGDAPAARPPIRDVTLATLAPAPVDEFYEATGTVRAARISAVAGRVMGTVTSLLVKEGDLVEQGQLLLTIDDRDAVQKERGAEAGHREALKALEAAERNRELTDITHRRYRKMFEEKAISRQEMDQFETQNRLAALEEERVKEMVDRASAGLAEARIYRGFTRVTSPSRGVVTEKRTEIGSMAIPGQPLLTVESDATFRAEIAVDESLSGRLKIGQPVFVFIDALAREIRGKIAEILPAIDPLSRSFTVKVPVSGPGLRSGLYVRVRFPLGKREILLAPANAIVEKGQLTGVYAVDGQGVVTYRLIRTGRLYGGGKEILSGLRAGDRIIVGGVEKAVDGGVVELAK